MVRLPAIGRKARRIARGKVLNDVEVIHFVDHRHFAHLCDAAPDFDARYSLERHSEPERGCQSLSQKQAFKPGLVRASCRENQISQVLVARQRSRKSLCCSGERLGLIVFMTEVEGAREADLPKPV